MRHGLDGEPVEPVSDEHRVEARKQMVELDARRAEARSAFQPFLAAAVGPAGLDRFTALRITFVNDPADEETPRPFKRFALVNIANIGHIGSSEGAFGRMFVQMMPPTPSSAGSGNRL